MSDRPYRELLGAMVHAHDWWFAPVRGVQLGAETQWRGLGDYVQAAANTERRPVPDDIDLDWVCSALLVGLGMFKEPTLPLELVACTVRHQDSGRSDEAHPMLLEVKRGQPGLVFRANVEIEIVDEITFAFVCRLVR